MWVGGVGRWLEGHDSLRDLNELTRIFPTDHVKQLKLKTLGFYVYICILYWYINIFIWDVSCFAWLSVFNGSGAFVWTLEFFHLAALFHLQGWRRLNYLYHSFPNQVYLPKECWCSFPSQIMSNDVGLHWRLLFKSRHGWSAKMQKCETALRQKTHGWVRKRGHHYLNRCIWKSWLEYAILSTRLDFGHGLSEL